MKKISLILMMFLVLITASCSGDSPKLVAEKFLTAMENQDFEEAKKYSDDSMKQLLTMLDGMPKDNNKKAENAKIKVTRVENEDNKAKVFYIIESPEIEEESKEQSIDLKKIDGKWKVSFNKEDSNKETPNNQPNSMNPEDETNEEEIKKLEDIESEVISNTEE